MMRIQNDFIIIDPIGLHARPATSMCNKANLFKSNITIIHNGREANCKSILGPMALGITTGDTISIVVIGEDAIEAMNGMKDVFQVTGTAKLK